MLAFSVNRLNSCVYTDMTCPENIAICIFSAPLKQFHANNEFIEYARVFDNIYGTLASEVIERVKNGEDVFLDIDVQGALQIKAAAEKDEFLKKVCDFIILAPPSLDVLEKRLRGRATDSAEQIEMRLAKAKHELSFYKEYNYVVINDQLDEAVQSVEAIIRSLRCCCSRLPEDFLQ